MLAITDDLYKSLEEAMSDTINEKIWSWKQGTHDSRMEGNCCIIDIGTRWSETDVIGKLEASSGIFYQQPQSTITAIKSLQCENVGVYLIDENGNIGLLVDDVQTPAKYSPIPIQSLFVGDLKLGGFAEPDSNAISWKFRPNWSDNFNVSSM